MIWNETKECMSRDEMTNLQSARLRKLVDRVYHSVEYYRKKMQAVGLEPGDIRGSGKASIYHKGRFERHIPLRHVCGA